MARLYIKPPNVHEIIWTVADWIARMYRVRVVIKINGKNGKHIVEVENPDEDDCNET